MNLDHSIITSPIDGVVVSRNVDVGQTVAASLQAPTLFTIANDLTNMQVLASIDEADVGQVREGGKARFTVDAFPGQVFNGDVTQVRLNAQTLQNVVTYAAVITVSNPDQKLMPGMTANITLPVARRDDVLRVPNGALRFKPELTDQQQKDVQAKIDAFRQQLRSQNDNEAEQQKSQPEPAPQHPASQISTPDPAGASADKAVGKGQNPSVDSGQKQPNNQGAGTASSGNAKQRRQSSGQADKAVAQQGDHQNTNADKAGGRHRGQQSQSGTAVDKKQTPSPAPAQVAVNSQTAGGGGRRSSGGQRQIQALWVLTANKTLEARIVRTGITDGRFTEIVAGDLKEGDLIVTGQSETGANSNKSPQTTTPFQQRPPGAGGGRGR